MKNTICLRTPPILPKGKESKFLPIAFHSGTFQGSEVNWAAFQKEAAAIHRGIK